MNGSATRDKSSGCSHFGQSSKERIIYNLDFELEIWQTFGTNWTAVHGEDIGRYEIHFAVETLETILESEGKLRGVPYATSGEGR